MECFTAQSSLQPYESLAIGCRVAVTSTGELDSSKVLAVQLFKLLKLKKKLAASFEDAVASPIQL